MQNDGPPDPGQSTQRFDRGFWDDRWSQVLGEHAARAAQRPPNAYLTASAGGLTPGRALDAGCGHGSETPWLAARGWRVTAVDFSVTALAHGRSTALRCRDLRRSPNLIGAAERERRGPIRCQGRPGPPWGAVPWKQPTV